MLTGTLLLVSSLIVGQVEEPVSHYEHLKGLECYVGTWIGKGRVSEHADHLAGEETTVPVTIEWILNKNVLVADWKVEVRGQVVNQGKWLWWWDTRAKQIKALSVMTMGYYGESVWTKQGDKWVAKWNGGTPDGKASSEVLTTITQGSDVLIHESTEIMHDGKSQPDSRTVYTRVK
jgi:hypothetical protein